MKKALTEIKRCLSGRFFLTGIASVVMLCMLSNGYQFEDGTGWTIGELFIRGDRELYLSNVDMSAWKIWRCGFGTWTGILLPLALGFGYIYSLGEEGKSGNIKFWLIRENKFSYCASKMIACMIAGGVILLVGYALFGVLVFARFPRLENYGKEWVSYLFEQAEGNHITGIVLRRCADVFLYGMAMNVYAFGVTIFFQDKYVTMCFPIMISYMYTAFLQKVQIGLIRRQEYDKLESLFTFEFKNIINGITWKSRLMTFGGIVTVYLVLLVAFVKMMNRREMASGE